MRRLEKLFKRKSLPVVVRALAPPSPAGFGALETRLRQPGPLRLLVVRQDNRLGNLVLLVPFLRALRLALPSAEIAFLTGDGYPELEGAFPWVDRWIVQEKRRHRRNPWLFPLWLRDLRKGGWHVAFEMSNHNTHSYYNCVLTAASGAPFRVGFDEPRNAGVLSHPVPVPDPRLPFALAPLAILAAAGLPTLPSAPRLVLQQRPSPPLERFLRESVAGAGYLVLHVGGRGGKSWPLEAWTDLVARLRAGNSAPLVLVGGPDEIERMDDLRRSDVRGNPNVFVAPALGLSDLAHLIGGAAVYVGCDTGVMHLAAALGTSTVALFFRSNPLHYAPLGHHHRTVLLADPYRAADAWDVPLAGVERSRLLVAAEPGEASARGIPEVGTGALSIIEEAILELCGTRHP